MLFQLIVLLLIWFNLCIAITSEQRGDTVLTLVSVALAVMWLYALIV
jgi:hypothetical protein